ncbi:MAG TPA: hypothetical protein VL728_16040 [Cyclobacteriaceae bacterium]|nr:hypothetical protein [Cyclobacteriaceae bacterium]
MKSVEDMPVLPFAVTEILPVVAPAGTTTVIADFVTEEIVDVRPLNFTMLAAAELPKLDPFIITVDPTTAAVGEKSVIVGFGTV